MTRKEKQEARVERYLNLAEKASKRASAAFERSNKAVDGIPLGQPILTDHYSANGHRKCIEKSNKAMAVGVRESDKAEYFRQKAESAARNTNIYLGDEDAIERLKEKVAKLTKLQEKMKATNKIVRSKNMNENDKVKELIIIGIPISKAIRIVRNFETFPAFALTNNNAKIKAAKMQLEKAYTLANKEDIEYDFNGGCVEICYSENRLRIYFNNIPSEDIRTALKQHGFRWSRHDECWQTSINYRSERFVKENFASKD